MKLCEFCEMQHTNQEVVEGTDWWVVVQHQMDILRVGCMFVALQQLNSPEPAAMIMVHEMPLTVKRIRADVKTVKKVQEKMLQLASCGHRGCRWRVVDEKFISEREGE